MLHKHFLRQAALMLVGAFVLASCSKEEPGVTPPPGSDGPQLSSEGSSYDLQDIDDFYEAWVDYKNDCTITTLDEEIEWELAKYMVEGSANFEYRFYHDDFRFDRYDSTAFTFQTNSTANGIEVINRNDLFVLYDNIITHLESVKPIDGKFAAINLEQHGSDLVMESAVLKPKQTNTPVSINGISTGKDWWAKPVPVGRFGECSTADDHLDLGDAEDLIISSANFEALHNIWNNPSIPKPQLPPNTGGNSIETWFSDVYFRDSYTHYDVEEFYDENTNGDCMDDTEINADVDAVLSVADTLSYTRTGTYFACIQIVPDLLVPNNFLHRIRFFFGKPTFTLKNTQNVPTPN